MCTILIWFLNSALLLNFLKQWVHGKNISESLCAVLMCLCKYVLFSNVLLHTSQTPFSSEWTVLTWSSIDFLLGNTFPHLGHFVSMKFICISFMWFFMFVLLNSLAQYSQTTLVPSECNRNMCSFKFFLFANILGQRLQANWLFEVPSYFLPTACSIFDNLNTKHLASLNHHFPCPIHQWRKFYLDPHQYQQETQLLR